jgi:hypothetical protein
MKIKRIFYLAFIFSLALQISFPASLFADVIGKFNDIRHCCPKYHNSQIHL